MSMTLMPSVKNKPFMQSVVVLNAIILNVVASCAAPFSFFSKSVLGEQLLTATGADVYKNFLLILHANLFVNDKDILV